MSTVSQTTREPPLPKRVPPLRPGDRLTAEEFERRYDAMPNLKIAELIEGVVYLPSGVSQEEHGGPHFDVTGLLGYYRAFTPGTQGGNNSTLRLDLNNRPQPDVFLRVLRSHGGRSGTDEDGYVIGAPELIAEVTASTVSYDLHDKLAVYRRHGVLEYVVWRVEDEEIDWFILRAGRFEPLARTADGWYQSEVFPGLWLDPAALIHGDMNRLLQVLQQGLASPGHAEFVRGLQEVARTRSGSR